MSTRATTIDPERQMLGEVEMVGQDRWEEIHRRAGAGASIRAIARELDADRKTVRRCLRQTEWKPYERAARADTLLATHASYLRRRAADVGYSAQVLFQELRGRQYEGSYETVKRFVRPLREMQLYAAVTRTRFETPPGLQSQIRSLDWQVAPSLTTHDAPRGAPGIIGYALTEAMDEGCLRAETPARPAGQAAGGARGAEEGGGHRRPERLGTPPVVQAGRVAEGPGRGVGTGSQRRRGHRQLMRRYPEQIPPESLAATACPRADDQNDVRNRPSGRDGRSSPICGRSTAPANTSARANAPPSSGAGPRGPCESVAGTGADDDRPAAVDPLTAPRVVTLGQIPVVVVRSATALRARPQTDVHFAWSSAA